MAVHAGERDPVVLPKTEKKMGWLVHGSPRDLSFRVDKFGISISGDGEQSYTNSSVILEDQGNRGSTRGMDYLAGLRGRGIG